MSRATAGFSATTAMVMGRAYLTYLMSTACTSRLPRKSTRPRASRNGRALSVLAIRRWSPSPSCQARSKCATGRTGLAPPAGLRVGCAHALPPRARCRLRRRGARARRRRRRPTRTRARRYTELAGGRAACTASRDRTRPRRSPRGARSAAAASSSCPRAPARATSPCWPSTTSGAARSSSRPRSTWCGSGSTCSRATFGGPIGLVGGGEHDVQPLTVTTYDSAFLHMEHLGARFGLVVFDECHHLPGARYALAARACLAPFRLGLTATPERTDGRDAELDEPHRPRSPIARTSSSSRATTWPSTTPSGSRSSSRPRSAPSTTPSAPSTATSSRSHGIRMSEPVGLGRSSSSTRRRATRAAAPWRPTDGSARSPSRRRRKLDVPRAPAARSTATTARSSSRRTTPPPTRSRGASSFPSSPTRPRCASAAPILAGLGEGTYRAVATSKVLNEGVDVPDANVAVDPLGQRLGARARAAPRAHPAQEGATSAPCSTSSSRQAHDRDVHERAAAGAQCLPLIS